MRPAAPTTRFGPRPPADPMFDPFWARANEAGITVVVHAGDSGYSSQGYAADGFAATFEGGGRPTIKYLNIERAAYDFLASLVFDELFDRFPNVRVASVENGSEFLPDLFRKLASTNRKIPGFFPEDPLETFRRNIWINPFWEDDPYEIAELMGADRVIFGSDWPHIEGMPQPLDYVRELKEFDDESRRRDPARQRPRAERAPPRLTHQTRSRSSAQPPSRGEATTWSAIATTWSCPSTGDDRDRGAPRAARRRSARRRSRAPAPGRARPRRSRRAHRPTSRGPAAPP